MGTRVWNSAELRELKYVSYSTIPTRQLRSGDKNLFMVPRFNKARWGGRAFSTLVPRLWNSLPVKLSALASHSLFRKALKTWLFAQAAT